MKKLTTQLFLLLATISTILNAHEGPWTSARPDGHAPITVMGDHMHAMGEWMLSYRFMSMDMEGLLRGSQCVTTDSQLKNTGAGEKYSMVPLNMTMDMHMVGAMYAISDKWTLMGMLNYLDNEMTMVMEMEHRGHAGHWMRMASQWQLPWRTCPQQLPATRRYWTSPPPSR